MAVEKQIEVMDEEEMKNAYKTLNSWKWPEKFGEKPEGWDELPNYRKPYMEACKTKEDIIRPYMKAIRRKIRHEEIYPSSDILKDLT